MVACTVIGATRAQAISKTSEPHKKHLPAIGDGNELISLEVAVKPGEVRVS